MQTKIEYNQLYKIIHNNTCDLSRIKDRFARLESYNNLIGLLISVDTKNDYKKFPKDIQQEKDSNNIYKYFQKRNIGHSVAEEILDYIDKNNIDNTCFISWFDCQDDESRNGIIHDLKKLGICFNSNNFGEEVYNLIIDSLKQRVSEFQSCNKRSKTIDNINVAEDNDLVTTPPHTEGSKKVIETTVKSEIIASPILQITENMYPQYTYINTCNITNIPNFSDSTMEILDNSEEYIDDKEMRYCVQESRYNSICTSNPVEAKELFIQFTGTQNFSFSHIAIQKDSFYTIFFMHVNGYQLYMPNIPDWMLNDECFTMMAKIYNHFDDVILTMPKQYRSRFRVVAAILKANDNDETLCNFPDFDYSKNLGLFKKTSNIVFDKLTTVCSAFFKN